MKRVILESPYASTSRNPLVALYQLWRNLSYARKCVRHSLMQGEAPIASHLLYTQPDILNDRDPVERKWGIEAGLAWGAVADATVVYMDRGFSPGMKHGVAAAQFGKRPVEFRYIEGEKK